jgi:hypothetical protein
MPQFPNNNKQYNKIKTKLMGSSPSKLCLCCKSNNSIPNNEYQTQLILEEKAQKIQAIYRGFAYRKHNSYLFQNKNSTQNRLSSTTSSPQKEEIREISMSYSTEARDNNPIILKLKGLIPKFELDEKEKYFLSLHKTKTKALLYPTGAIYKGMVNDNMQREGYGKLYLSNGNIYEGFFVDNRMEGRGRLLNVEGYVIEGDFVNDIVSGYAKWMDTEGTVYKGNWSKNKKNGIGEETYLDGSHYFGNFVNGKKNGKGKFSFPEGNSYEGEFWNNEIKGEGKYKFKDGRTYLGQFFNNKMNGYGMFYWPDRKKYYGHYNNNNKKGFGLFTWPDGKKFEGFWKEGKQHGYGFVEIQNVKTYSEWYEGKRVKVIEDEVTKRTIDNMIKDKKEEFDYQSFSMKIEQYEKELVNPTSQFTNNVKNENINI